MDAIGIKTTNIKEYSSIMNNLNSISFGGLETTSKVKNNNASFSTMQVKQAADSTTSQSPSDTLTIKGKQIKKKTAIAVLIGSLTTLTASIIFASSMVKKGNIMLNDKKGGLFKKFKESLKTFTNEGKEQYDSALKKVNDNNNNNNNNNNKANNIKDKTPTNQNDLNNNNLDKQRPEDTSGITDKNNPNKNKITSKTPPANQQKANNNQQNQTAIKKDDSSNSSNNLENEILITPNAKKVQDNTAEQKQTAAGTLNEESQTPKSLTPEEITSSNDKNNNSKTPQPPKEGSSNKQTATQPDKTSPTTPPAIQEQEAQRAPVKWTDDHSKIIEAKIPKEQFSEYSIQELTSGITKFFDISGEKPLSAMDDAELRKKIPYAYDIYRQNLEKNSIAQERAQRQVDWGVIKAETTAKHWLDQQSAAAQKLTEEQTAYNTVAEVDLSGETVLSALQQSKLSKEEFQIYGKNLELLKNVKNRASTASNTAALNKAPNSSQKSMDNLLQRVSNGQIEPITDIDISRKTQPTGAQIALLCKESPEKFIEYQENLKKIAQEKVILGSSAKASKRLPFDVDDYVKLGSLNDDLALAMTNMVETMGNASKALIHRSQNFDLQDIDKLYDDIAKFSNEMLKAKQKLMDFNIKNSETDRLLDACNRVEANLLALYNELDNHTDKLKINADEKAKTLLLKKSASVKKPTPPEDRAKIATKVQHTSLNSEINGLQDAVKVSEKNVNGVETALPAAKASDVADGLPDFVPEKSDQPTPMKDDAFFAKETQGQENHPVLDSGDENETHKKQYTEIVNRVLGGKDSGSVSGKLPEVSAKEKQQTEVPDVPALQAFATAETSLSNKERGLLGKIKSLF